MDNPIEQLQPILSAIESAGGLPLIVGGAVRDQLLGYALKDIDIEVYRLSIEQLAEVLTPFGRLDAVGRSFGILKLRLPSGRDFDFALPRRESKIGAGHRGFLAAPDPTMTPREAAARRDFTINAMALTPAGEILDFFGGQADLHARILRHTTAAFAEDPLRVLRGMQFAARFDMRLAPETAALCRALLAEAPTLAIERIWGEWWKWAVKSVRPSAGLQVLAETGWIDLYPELLALIGCPQDPLWHPEGWSIAELTSEAGTAGTAQPLRTDNRLTLREFITRSAAKAAMIPRLHSASGAEPSVNASPSGFSTANMARTLGSLSAPELSPAVFTEAESLMWSFGSSTFYADEIIRVMFEVPLRSMVSVVLSTDDDFEVVRRIVHPVAVYVMNVLPFFQGTTELQFHNDTVNGDSAILTEPGSVHVPTIVMDARTASVDGDVFFYFDLAVVRNSDIAHVFGDNTRSRVFQVGLGHVWTHTLHVVDAAAAIAARDGLEDEERAVLLFAALCHDLGKPATTTHDPDGRIRSPGHAEAGIAQAQALLLRIGCPSGLVAQVVPLVREHMAHIGMAVTERSVRRLALRLAPATIEQWERLVEADHSGRPPLSPGAPGAEIGALARQIDVAAGRPAPILLGRHLIEAGMQPGPALGAALRRAYQAQIDGAFTTVEDGLAWVARDLHYEEHEG